MGPVGFSIHGDDGCVNDEKGQIYVEPTPNQKGAVFHRPKPAAAALTAMSDAVVSAPRRGISRPGTTPSAEGRSRQCAG